MIREIARCRAGGFSKSRVLLKEAAKLRHRRYQQNKNRNHDGELSQRRTTIVPIEAAELLNQPGFRVHLVISLAIQNGGHDVGNIGVARIKTDDADNVVAHVFDLDVAACTVTHLRPHKETFERAHVDDLVTLAVGKLCKRNDGYD